MLSHVNSLNQPTMVNISEKSATRRIAEAMAEVQLPTEVLDLLVDGELHAKKGPVFATAIIAGTMAAKRTHELIPFCHSVPLENCKITITIDPSHCVQVRCIVETHHKTGVEMEALTGASVAALTIYDMCKAVSHNIQISNTRLLAKSGGKRDFKTTEAQITYP